MQPRTFQLDERSEPQSHALAGHVIVASARKEGRGNRPKGRAWEPPGRKGVGTARKEGRGNRPKGRARELPERAEIAP